MLLFDVPEDDNEERAKERKIRHYKNILNIDNVSEFDPRDDYFLTNLELYEIEEIFTLFGIVFWVVELSKEKEKYIVYNFKKDTYIYDGSRSEKADEWLDNLSDYDVEMLLPEREEESFWDSVPEKENVSFIYHATPRKNVESIKKRGLEPRNETRGISNRSTGDAIFCFTDEDENALSGSGSYGDCVFSIDLGLMKKDGYMPEVTQEESVNICELKRSLAHMIGLDNYYCEVESWEGISEDTLIIHGHVPPKYLNLETE
jgi:hypothetical protein